MLVCPTTRDLYYCLLWIVLYVTNLIQSVLIVHTKSLKIMNMLSSAKNNIKLNLASPHSLVQFYVTSVCNFGGFSK